MDNDSIVCHSLAMHDPPCLSSQVADLVASSSPSSSPSDYLQRESREAVVDVPLTSEHLVSYPLLLSRRSLANAQNVLQDFPLPHNLQPLGQGQLRLLHPRHKQQVSHHQRVLGRCGPRDRVNHFSVQSMRQGRSSFCCFEVLFAGLTSQFVTIALCRFLESAIAIAFHQRV